MNTCECGRVVHGSAILCKSCAKKAGWAKGDYDDQREKLRSLNSGRRCERLEIQQCDRFSTIDNAVRDAFQKVIGFDPLHEANPAWKFPRQIDDEESGSEHG